MRNVDFFLEKNITGKDLYDLCEFLGYEHYNAGEIVFKHGQPNDKMYIIIDGNVDFSINMKKDNHN